MVQFLKDFIRCLLRTIVNHTNYFVSTITKCIMGRLLVL